MKKLISYIVFTLILVVGSNLFAQQIPVFNPLASQVGYTIQTQGLHGLEQGIMILRSGGGQQEIHFYFLGEIQIYICM